MSDESTFHVVLDTDANITSFEGLAESISGYSASDVIGKNWFEIFIPHANKDEILSVFRSFLNGDISFWEYENTITCKDGTSCLIKWKNSLLRDSKNNPVGISSSGSVA